MSGYGKAPGINKVDLFKGICHTGKSPRPGADGAHISFSPLLQFFQRHLTIRAQVIVKEPEDTLSESIQMVGKDLSISRRCNAVSATDCKGVKVIPHGTGLLARGVAVPPFGSIVRRAGGTDVRIESALVALEVEYLKNRHRSRRVFGDIEHHIKIKVSAFVVTVESVFTAQSDTFESGIVFSQKLQLDFFRSRRNRTVKTLFKSLEDPGTLFFPRLL